jgi:glycosyltransferase involved in cell wall biosynthesis
MRILLASKSVFPFHPSIGGGDVIVGYHLVKGLAELGHEVHYVLDVGALPTMPERVVVHDVSIWHKKALSGVYASFSIWLIQHLVANLLAARTSISVLRRERYNFDIIHGHGNLATLLLCLAKRSVPIVYTEHDPSPWQCQYRSALESAIRKCVFRALDVHVFRRAEHTIFVSQLDKDEAVERWGIPQQKVSTIQNAVDLELFKGGVGAEEGEEWAELEPGYCLFIGRLTSRKGVDNLLRALVGTDLRCVIVGDGPLREQLPLLAKELGLSERVSFLGPVSHAQLPAIYRKASMFVFPSHADTMPLVLLEAMACGIPPIATSISGVPRAVQDGYNGLLVSPGNVDELHAAIRRLSADETLREKLGRNGRATVAERFTWRAYAQKVIEVYENLLNR